MSNAAFVQDEGFLSITADDVDLNIPLYPDYDRGTFIAARTDRDDEGNQYVLALSETDNTFAAYLITRDDGATSQSFIGRTTELDALPTGVATLTGTYVGAFVNEERDNLRSYITGDTTIDVDFDAMTIAGRVENRTADLFELGIPFVLEDELATIDLAETSIAKDGSFSGENTRDAVFEDTTTTGEVAVNYAGLIGGASVDAPEIVGTIDVLRTSSGVTGVSSFQTSGRETGVFVVGH